MRDHRNPHGANAQELKEQKLADDLLLAEFQWNDAKTIEDKKRALAQVNLAMGEIEKFEASREDNKKPNLYFDIDPSLIPTMMQEMEARIIRHEKLQNWQNFENGLPGMDSTQLTQVLQSATLRSGKLISRSHLVQRTTKQSGHNLPST